MASALPPDPSLPTPRSRVDAVRDFFLRTFAGRSLVVGLLLKGATLGAEAALGPIAIIRILSTFGGLCLVVGVVMLLYRLAQSARRRLLWRVRRKLILSYIFIGFVPAILIVTFFVLFGLLLFSNLSSYLIRGSLNDLAEEAAYVARTATLEVEHGAPGTVPTLLQRRMTADSTLYPGISIAIVPLAPGRCAWTGAPTAAPALSVPVAAGPWLHTTAPPFIPPWVTCGGFAGVLAYDAGVRSTSAQDTADVVVRAVALPEQASGFAVVVDIPFSAVVKSRVEASTGLAIFEASLNGQVAPTVAETAVRATGSADAVPTVTGDARRFPWVALLDHINWATGRPEPLTMKIGLSVPAIYEHLSASQASLGGARSFGDQLLFLLFVIAGLFLVIEAGALAMGLALARSITGSVHELFAGTERVRQGDFGHRIPVLANDQLGELADSFNLMTGSIEDLLRQAAEKKRLEEEMRLAREIQMSLLPRGPLLVPGLTVSAMCVPAREVGGDYYDILPLPDGRYGLLIADVSGKGMSAALYMAELKGLILSLSQIHPSPRDLLLNANRLISEHLDSRSFITMTYAVIDPAAATMTYARAGHTPLMFFPRDGDADRRVQILAPDGMVLGLRIDRGERFEALLTESSLHFGAGDLLVLFTDGISEAMNEHSECFGEPRLASLIEEHAHLPFEELRERILREIDAFVGGAPQHDDMTMILLKVDDPAPAADTPVPENKAA
ncbi:MAG: SpoIIE family protein phosphatase [Acidobacteria bacterium]|nr:SpoIIE family protein phosphatase [Acidobacteriota bacterium]